MAYVSEFNSEDDEKYFPSGRPKVTSDDLTCNKEDGDKTNENRDNEDQKKQHYDPIMNTDYFEESISERLKKNKRHKTNHVAQRKTTLLSSDLKVNSEDVTCNAQEKEKKNETMRKEEKKGHNYKEMYSDQMTTKNHKTTANTIIYDISIAERLKKRKHNLNHDTEPVLANNKEKNNDIYEYNRWKNVPMSKEFGVAEDEYSIPTPDSDSICKQSHVRAKALEIELREDCFKKLLVVYNRFVNGKIKNYQALVDVLTNKSYFTRGDVNHVKESNKSNPEFRNTTQYSCTNGKCRVVYKKGILQGHICTCDNDTSKNNIHVAPAVLCLFDGVQQHMSILIERYERKDETFKKEKGISKWKEQKDTDNEVIDLISSADEQRSEDSPVTKTIFETMERSSPDINIVGLRLSGEVRCNISGGNDSESSSITLPISGGNDSELSSITFPNSKYRKRTRTYKNCKRPKFVAVQPELPKSDADSSSSSSR